MNNNSLIYGCISLLAMSCSAPAWAGITLGSSASSTISGQQKKPPILYCPPIKYLTKGADSIWRSKAEGGWKSYSQSFADKISRFVGAQWQGIGIGNIVCTYQTSSGGTFPVQITYSVLVKNPVLTKEKTEPYINVPNNWAKVSYTNSDGKQTIMNCKSDGDTENCPFLPGVIRKSVNVNQALTNAKKNYHPLSQPNL